MAVAIAQVAAQGVGFDQPAGVEAVGERFLDWFRKGPPDIGAQTRTVLSQAGKGADLIEASAKYAREHELSAGNGSLMRTGPVALSHLGDDAAITAGAEAISALTHADHLATEACIVWSIAVDRAVRQGRLNGIYDGIELLEDNRQPFWRATIKDAETAAPASFRPNGFVVKALQAAWSAIVSSRAHRGSDHFEAGLRAAVAIGDDTDTVASIAGTLLGAGYGASSVPFLWRRRLAGWPSGVGHADLVGMAVLAVNGGCVDQIGWPATDDLMAAYSKEWSPSGRIVSFNPDPGVLWGDVAGLASVDADAFISLCRIGLKQRRGNDHHEVWLIDSSKPMDNIDLPFVLADTADAVAALRQEGHVVFVHCVRGERRTPAVAATWLHRHHGMGLSEAKRHVASRMPGADLTLVNLARDVHV
jgi:ADP-ribosylglycohydrolase